MDLLKELVKCAAVVFDCIVSDMELLKELVGAAGMVLVCIVSAGHVVHYYLKFFILLLVLSVSATVFIPLMLIRPKDYKNALLPTWMSRTVANPLLGLRWTVRGKENIVQDSGCVVLINHQSGLDMLVFAELWHVMPRCTVISKKEVFYLWPFGLAAWLWGTIFINRRLNEQAQATVNKTGDIIRENKARLCMFPEGTRHGGEELLPFKKGAFHVAIASQMPIQPVVVSRYYFLDSEQRRFGSGDVIIKILPAITTEGLTKADLSSLLSKAYTVMSEEYTKLTEEVLPVQKSE